MQRIYTREKEEQLSLSLMKPNKLLVLLVVFISGCAPLALSKSAVEVITAKGEYSFGPDMSERDACELAKRYMIENAARDEFGVRISGNKKMSCSDEWLRDFGDACEITQNLLSYVSEEYEVINQSINKVQVLYPQGTKNYLCSVEGIVTLRLFESHQRTSWATDLIIDTAEVSNNMLAVSLSISSSTVGFHYVFHELSGGELELIFPNAFDRTNEFKGTKKIPSANSLRKYEIKVPNSGKSVNFYMLSTQRVIESLQDLEIKKLTFRERDAMRRSLSKGSWVQTRA